MLAGVLARIAAASATDAPWLLPYGELARRVAAERVPGVALAQALNAVLTETLPIELDAGTLRFEAPDTLAVGETYEAHIARTARVPTRDDCHDLFNALVWLVHPTLKSCLNRLHGAELARAGSGATRGPLRDALTLFDENGALLRAPEPLAQALRARDWEALFGTLRPLWSQARLQIVGHALLEKLLEPRKAITAHVWVADPGDPDQDGVLPAGFTPARLAAKPFLPLPVLGVPGWWPGNEAPAFYADSQVFRPARR
ncbi:MAG: DUF3025 domain-containing protein [Burkholderiaceae bacterium]